MIDANQFRANFPEFASTVTFPNAQVDFWLKFAYKLVNADRWQDCLDEGIQLFLAHHLALWALARSGGNNVNGIPGVATGVISSESVDKVSVSYDTQGVIEENAGHWNQTLYGRQFIRLAKMFGAGPIQVGIGEAPSAYSASAWAGVLPFNF